jgi:succinate dehydrogenase subunit D
MTAHADDTAAGEARYAPRPGPNRLQGLLWVAFANAAVLIALIAPAHILVQGVLAPLGLVPSFDRRYATFAAGIGNPLVKIYLLVVIAASFYLAGHRVRYVVHELGVHGKLAVGTVCYGLAVLGVAVAAYLLLTLP